MRTNPIPRWKATAESPESRSFRSIIYDGNRHECERKVNPDCPSHPWPARDLVSTSHAGGAHRIKGRAERISQSWHEVSRIEVESKD
eukprot:3939627-Rhodomonas_salina.3